jgi:hypothetical protein
MKKKEPNKGITFEDTILKHRDFIRRAALPEQEHQLITLRNDMTKANMMPPNYDELIQMINDKLT